MLLTLGAQSYDITTRSLVVGIVEAASADLDDLCRRAEELVKEGADVVEIGASVIDVDRTLAAVANALPTVPLAVTADQVSVAAKSGAVMLVDATGFGDEQTLAAAAEAGAAVVGLFDATIDAAALVQRVRTAEGAGLPPARLLVGPDLAATGPDLLPRVRQFATLGYPLVLSAHEDTSSAVLAAAVTGGCRVIRTPAVRPARRVCDVLAAVLEAGG